MARFFLLALLVTSLLIRGKAEVWLFPFSSFHFLFLVSWVLGCVGFHTNRKKDRWVTFRKPTKEEANKSISVDHKMAKFSRVCKVTVVVRGCYAGKKVVIVKPHDEGPKTTASYMPWLPVSRDTHWRLLEGTIRRRLPRGLKLGYSSRSSTTTTCFQPDTLAIETFEEAKKVIRKTFEERHKAGKNRWFFTKLRFWTKQKILIDTTNIAVDCFVIKKKKKNEGKRRVWTYRCQNG